MKINIRSANVCLLGDAVLKTRFLWNIDGELGSRRFKFYDSERFLVGFFVFGFVENIKMVEAEVLIFLNQLSKETYFSR